MALEINVPFPRLLDSSLAEVRRINPVSASVSLELTPLSTAEIELPDGEALPEMGWVEMFTPSGSAGIFRVSSPQTGYGGNSGVTQLEHGAVEIGDWLILQEYDEAMSAQAAFSAVWGHYRGNRWRLGAVEASGTVNLSCDHDTVLSIMCDLIDQLPGYMLHFDQTTSPWTVSVKQKPTTVQSEGRLSRNVSDASIEFDYTDLCTRLYMEGLPSPGYIQDGTAIRKYGIIERHLSGDEDAAETGETESVEQDHASRRQQIMRVAQAYLEKYKKPKCTIQISGADFSAVTGETLDRVETGNLYRLALPDYETTVEETVISVHWDDIYNDGFACTITLSEDENMITLPIVQLVQSVSGGGGGGGGGGSKEAIKEQFKKYQTFIDKTDEYIKLLATESEWDEAAQEGRITFFTEMERTARYVTESAYQELPYDDWKTQTLKSDPTADVSEDAYQRWIAANPYAIYNYEYIDATQSRHIISKTGINELGENETVLSRITQEADRVESSVYASQSQVYSAIGQTASNIRVELADTEQNLYNYINLTASGIRQQITNAGNRTIVNDTDPRGDTYSPKDGDIWIESVHDGTWDGAEGFDWEHDEDYDWTKVQGAKVWTWKNNQWQLVADRQQLVNYSDFVNTADLLISQKITELANEEGQIEVYRSLIEQSAERIRSEVYGATSDIYTYIHQTASSVSIAAGQRPTTVVQNSHTDGVPTSINGRGLKENDIWIDTADQTSWDAALNFNWNDDLEYDWNELRSDKIYVYRNGKWQLSVDGTVLAEDTDLQVERDKIALMARNIDTLDGYARENFAQLQVRANEIYSEVLDRTNNLGSRITQTATQIRSEVYAANSQIYSEIVQTASNILLHVENEISDMGASLEVTAEEIRSSVYAAKSSFYSSITQTASSIRSEVTAAKSSLYSSIIQTANSIKSEVYASQSSVYSSITQTASSIKSEVNAAKSSLYSSIMQTASSISLSVDNRPTTIVQNSHTSGTPISINNRGLKENDIWIDTSDQDSWDTALNFNWDDDKGYDWNELRSDKIYVYRNGAWQLALDGTVLTEDADLQIERDRVSLLARNVDTLDGYARENFAQLQVRADEIYSEVVDRTNNLGSRITQTATQIRSEVHASESQVYSEIVQTASNILLHVENAVSDMGATLEVTAEEIRSAVWSTQSSVYSSITQTASQIRSEVASTTSSLRSSINQNAEQITLKVNKGDVASTINQTAQSVKISASAINLEGYVTADELDAEKARFDNLTSGATTASTLKTNLLSASTGFTYQGSSIQKNSITMGDITTPNQVLATGAINLSHSHVISFSESGGVVTATIGAAQATGGTANFNIADTAFYINAMSAQWEAAYDKVGMPSAGTGETFEVKVPSETEGEQETKTFTIQKGATPGTSGYASVALGQTVVGRISIGDWYTAGVGAGQSSVSALIVNGNNASVSGRHTLSAGSSMTVYPATYVGGTTSRNSGAALTIVAANPTPTVSGWDIWSNGSGTSVSVNVNGTSYSHTFSNYP